MVTPSEQQTQATARRHEWPEADRGGDKQSEGDTSRLEQTNTERNKQSIALIRVKPFVVKKEANDKTWINPNEIEKSSHWL